MGGFLNFVVLYRGILSILVTPLLKVHRYGLRVVLSLRPYLWHGQMSSVGDSHQNTVHCTLTCSLCTAREFLWGYPELHSPLHLYADYQ